jgi:RNA polymerase sigma-70 factor, ECF subfamily
MRVRTGASLAEIEALYRARFRVFVRVASGICGSEASGADAVHDAFVQAVRKRKAFRGDGPLQAWLWRLVVNAAKKRLPRPEPADPESRDGAENGFGDPVRAALAALPERQRLTLFLRYYADLDYAAIAVTLGVSPGTVAATINAAHNSLRRSLKEVDHQWT